MNATEQFIAGFVLGFILTVGAVVFIGIMIASIGLI